MVSMVVQLAEPVRDRRAASTRRAPGRDQAAPAAISATLQRYEGPSRCGGVVGALVVSLAGSSSPSCWGMVAAVVCGVGSVAGGSARRPRRRTKATEAARAPAAPVRTAASRFFPAPRESSRDSRDVRSPKALPRLAGNPGLPLARERLGRRRAATAAGRDAGCLLAPRATSRLEGVRLARRRLDRSGAVSLVGICSPSGRSVRLGFECRSG